ncbi:MULTISPECIES: hypothetical protein [unclassified Chitinophaga]|uniref:hypothetical protein n=1 Tax=unclassified Chitinophaga TaxID=2619133 RepID=UPI0030105492
MKYPLPFRCKMEKTTKIKKGQTLTHPPVQLLFSSLLSPAIASFPFPSPKLNLASPQEK